MHSAATKTKLDTIAKMLKNRPALTLDRIGRVDLVTNTNTDGVRQQILQHHRLCQVPAGTRNGKN